MPKEWKVSNMNVRDPIRWLAHLISFSHGENRDQIHWQFLQIYVVFSHSESTGCLQQKHCLATSWKERQNKREEERAFDWNFISSYNRCVACINLEIRNTNKNETKNNNFTFFIINMQIQIGSAENHVIQTKKLTGFDYYKDFFRRCLELLKSI